MATNGIGDPVSGSDCAETRSVCCYCGTGCGVLIEHRAGCITGVRGDPGHPANFGRLCTKGATLHVSAGLRTGRALHPMHRPSRGAALERLAWGSALDLAAQRFADVIRRDGPDAVAFYVSGQLLTEDYYVFNKLARALVGTNNIDSNSRLCMSSAVAGYKATLGADAVPCCYEDLAEADHLLIAGSNTAWAHPVVFRRIEEARRARPDLTITVIDPRRTETADFADDFLQIAPGSDLLLLNAMLHVLIWEDLVDREFIQAHTSGFEALRASVADCSPGNVARACGVSADAIIGAACRFGRARAALSLWCQGLNQSHHGSANSAALIHLHLATGQIGRAGAGPFSLTGQPNAMGGREVGAMASLLPAHRDPGNDYDRAELARYWGVPALPATAGLTAVELFDALAERRVKALWIACTNPAHSLPRQAVVRDALRAAEFVVLQEAYADTETAAFADLLLPAASWGEKEGTVTNSERRVSRVRAAIAPPGEALADWAIAADFARRLAIRLGRDGSGFDFADAAAVFAEHAGSSRGRDCDLSGLSHALLDAQGPQQWPFPAGARHGTPRLFTDRRFATEDGRARFAPIGFAVRHAPLPEAPSAQQPLLLLSGRLRDQWHGMSRSGKVPALAGHAPRAELALHPDELARRGLKAGMLVRVANERGALVLPLGADDGLAPGCAWLPMHWGGAVLAQPGVNLLTSPRVDPVSKQPALKQAPVSVSAIEFGWCGAWAVVAHDAEQGIGWRAALQPWLARFDYAAVSLEGRDRPVLSLRTAHEGPPDEALLAALDAILGTDAARAPLVFVDARRGIVKRARVEHGYLLALRLVGEAAAFDWLHRAMLAGEALGSSRPWLFAPLARPPGAAMTSSSRIVCSCHGVDEACIAAELAHGADLPRLQQQLRCGTACGSCLPALRRMLAAAEAAPDSAPLFVGLPLAAPNLHLRRQP
ncbi:MAG: molybdopterin-dependent oxidoreductase [Burkholderiaceae bacterium]